MAAKPSGQLVFSLRSWTGDYTTHDVPGGVAVSPNTCVICTINADGSGLQQLTGLGPSADNPYFSPDGQWLCFQAQEEGRYHLFRCRPDGTGKVNLTAGHRLGKDSYGFQCGADGRQVVYTVHDGQTGKVALMDADGGKAHIILKELGYSYMATLSPDGQAVAFANVDRGYALMYARLAGGEPRVLVPGNPCNIVPRFLPDGQTIIFLKTDHVEGDIWRVNCDGTGLRQLTVGNRYFSFRLSAGDQHGSSDGPEVSPDGTRIAYLAKRDDVAQVCTMAADGTDQRQLTHRATACGRVRWSPNGQWLAFVSFVERYPQLFVIPAAGGEPRQLTTCQGAVFFVQWRPPAR